jgi:hypothetical protein
MKRLLSLIFLLAITFACKAQKSDTTTYLYECERVTDGCYIYPTDNVASQPIVYIPPNTKVYTRTVKRGSLFKVYYGTHTGYVINRDFKFTKTQYKAIPDNIVQEQDNNFVVLGNKPQLPVSQSSGSQSSYSSGGGSVHVSGYYRKNGTYVSPYTRRSPSRH